MRRSKESKCISSVRKGDSQGTQEKKKPLSLHNGPLRGAPLAPGHPTQERTKRAHLNLSNFKSAPHQGNHHSEKFHFDCPNSLLPLSAELVLWSASQWQSGPSPVLLAGFRCILSQRVSFWRLSLLLLFLHWFASHLHWSLREKEEQVVALHGVGEIQKKNPNMSLCCWRRSWLYLFNVESYDTVKEKNRYLRRGLQSRKQKWRGYYLQSPVEAPFRSPTATYLTHSNEILLFQNKSISFTGAVFKKGYSIPNQCVYFDSTLNGLLTPDEAARLEVKDKKYCWASLIKWALLKEKRTEEKFCLACWSQLNSQKY